MTGRYVTPDEDSPERYRLYRLCECAACQGTGKDLAEWTGGRCSVCRGEGRTTDLVATASDPESLGVAIVTLAREHELEGCPIGILDKPHQDKPGTWLVKPWQASARNVSDAARTLAKSKGKEKT
jgi:hypothetical protein